MEKMKREWKRIVAIVLSVLMVSSTIDMSVFAASVSEGNAKQDELFAYAGSPQMTAPVDETETIVASGNCGIDGSNATYKIYDTDSDGSGDTLVISGSGPTDNIATVQYAAFFSDRDENAKVHAATIKAVVIEEGITTIGDKLLRNMPALETVSIPNSLTTIGWLGIGDCTALTDLVFGDNPSLNGLGKYALSGCTSLQDQELLQLNSLKTIDIGALNNTAYSPVILPPNIISVNSTFVEYGKIVYIPISVINETDTIFSNMGLVLGYELNDETKEAAITYMYCPRVENFFSGISIESELFGYKVTTVTQRLEDVPILCENHIINDYTCNICGYTTKCGDNCRWEYEDGVLSIIGYGEMYDYPPAPANLPEWLQKYRNNIREVHFDEGITKIGSCALWQASELEKIVFKGNAVKSIGSRAFSSCSKLRDVEIEKLTSLVSISASAFAACPSLGNITLNETTTELFNTVFYNSPNVKLACSENVEMAGGFGGNSLLLYKVENGQKVVTVPFAEMCEIPDIEYVNGSTLINPQDVIQIKEEFADKYQFDGYDYGVDVDFTGFTYEIAGGEITGTGDYMLNLSYQFSDNSGGMNTRTIAIPFKVVDHVHSTEGEEDRPASCIERAYCSVCGLEYGELANHRIAYSAVGSTITGTCSVCEVSCGEATISAPAQAVLTYDGNDKLAIVESDMEGIEASDIVYLPADKLTDGRPVNAGNYTASITLGEGANAVAVSVDYEIKKAELTVTTATAMGREYDGTNIVAISDITLSGIVGTDDVSVQTNVLTGTLDSANAGTYNSVTLPALSLTGAAAGNYTLEQLSGAVTTSVTIAKKAAPTVDAINKIYLYSGENAEFIDIAKLLPTDCGTAVYDVQTSGDIQYAGSVGVSNGVLNYTLASDAVNAQGTITVTATTDNYEDITITVNITLTERIPVELQEGAEVTLQNNTLTYGEPLSKLTFNNAVFVDHDRIAVDGTLAWKEPTATPNAGTTSAAWVFTPADSDYASVEGTVDIAVNKATPDVSVLPTVAEYVYNPEKSLADSNMTGGTVLGVDGVDLEGIWSWENTAIIPDANNSGYTAVFTPVDTENYEVITKTIAVPVTKATPFVVQMPEAESVSYGDVLSASQLIGGAAIYGNGAGEAGEEDDLGISMVIGVSQSPVAGSFAWKDGKIKPTVADSNTTPYMIVFTPNDTVNYNTVEFSLTLTVGKAVAPSVQPAKTMTVSYHTKTVGAVTLPVGWTWKETDKTTALTVGTPVTAKAVYTAADKDNFANLEFTVTITRAACGHVWNSGVITTKPTAIKTGVKTYTCTDCGATRTETVAALGAPKKGTTLKDSKNKAYYKVTKAGLKNGTVEYVKPVNKKAATVSIPATIKADGITYKVTSIAKNAFKSNKKVTKVTIGSNVKTIGANAFYGCTKLKTLTIGKNVTTIGDKAFYKCTALTKVTIPSKVTKIGKSAFYGCKKLKTVTIKTTKLNNSRVGSNAFKGIYSKAVIKVPKAKVKAYTTLLQKKGIGKTVTVKKY